jgi:hypothetical protein
MRTLGRFAVALAVAGLTLLGGTAAPAAGSAPACMPPNCAN